MFCQEAEGAEEAKIEVEEVVKIEGVVEEVKIEAEEGVKAEEEVKIEEVDNRVGAKAAAEVSITAEENNMEVKEEEAGVGISKEGEVNEEVKEGVREEVTAVEEEVTIFQKKNYV